MTSRNEKITQADARRRLREWQRPVFGTLPKKRRIELSHEYLALQRAANPSYYEWLESLSLDEHTNLMKLQKLDDLYKELNEEEFDLDDLIGISKLTLLEARRRYCEDEISATKKRIEQKQRRIDRAKKSRPCVSGISTVEIESEVGRRKAKFDRFISDALSKKI